MCSVELELKMNEETAEDAAFGMLYHIVKNTPTLSLKVTNLDTGEVTYPEVDMNEVMVEVAE